MRFLALFCFILIGCTETQPTVRSDADGFVYYLTDADHPQITYWAKVEGPDTVLHKQKEQGQTTHLLRVTVDCESRAFSAYNIAERKRYDVGLERATHDSAFAKLYSIVCNNN